MEEHGGFGFEDFAIEMEEFEVRKVRKHDRMWQVEEGGGIVQIPLYHEGVVYFGSMNRIFYAVDAGTGERLWQFRTEGILLESSPCFHEGMVYFGSYDRNMYCLEAATGKLAWKFETQGRINAAPHISGGRVYFGCEDQHMYCLDAETGSLIWKVQTQGEIYNFNKPLVHEGVVYIGCFDNFVRAIRIKDGSLLWKFPTGNYGCVCCPVLHDGRFYVTSRDGFVFCLTTDGKQIWKFSRNEPVSIPTVHEGNIYFGCEDQNLYCIDLEGREKWRYKTQGVIWLKPVGIGPNVLFPSFDCHIYLVNARTGKTVWKFRTEGEQSPLPPAYDTFEMVMSRKQTKAEERDGPAKRYEFRLDEEDNTSTYKSRITYQVSTQYAAKGKYQVDSDEEEF